ncbi:MAG: hypothetical protein EP307_06395, partial [Rhodobacteraceae bacterium]
MPRKVVIHLGFHKTGSTTVQQTLQRNRALLRPVLAVALRPSMRDVLSAARAFSVTGEAFDRARFAARAALMLQDLPQMKRRVLCLSAEELAGHLPGRPGVRDYGAAVPLAQDLAHAAAALFPQAEIAFFVMTRDPAAWLDSAYWQHVKSSSMTMDIATFRSRFAGAARLDDIAVRIARATGLPVHGARLEEAARLPQGPAQPLLDLCEVPEDLRARMVWPAPANRRPD